MKELVAALIAAAMMVVCAGNAIAAFPAVNSLDKEQGLWLPTDSVINNSVANVPVEQLSIIKFPTQEVGNLENQSVPGNGNLPPLASTVGFVDYPGVVCVNQTDLGLVLEWLRMYQKTEFQEDTPVVTVQYADALDNLTAALQG